MRVGVVDIGTNSMRLLITDGVTDAVRLAEVTGLGHGVDRTGALSDDAIEATVEVLGRYGEMMSSHDVGRRLAIATSAARDASNRDLLFDRAESALGVRPTLISGDEEARLAWEGAISSLEIHGSPLVCDIGGGSTELVTRGWRVSIDVGSVRLTDRILTARPPGPGQMEEARSVVANALRGVDGDRVDTLVGVAGTWTSLGAMAQDLAEYDRDRVHGHPMTPARLEEMVSKLSTMTVDETASIPSLDPKRAPVILAGSVIASEVANATRPGEIVISECDTLDGAAADLLALA